MSDESLQREQETSVAASKRWPKLLATVGVVVFLLLLAAIVIPGQLVSPLARHEVNAMESLRALHNLELHYAAAHPAAGFTCQFDQLRLEAPSNAVPIRAAFLSPDSFEGYRFSLSGCEIDAKGVVIRYGATAVPLVPDKTGVRAFCIDQTGELQFGKNASPKSCRRLEE